MKYFSELKEFFHFVQYYEGELNIRHTTAYHNEKPVAAWTKPYGNQNE